MSPFLFILVVEVLNKLIKSAKEGDLIEGLVVGKDKVGLSHLQFANVTIIFCPVKEEVLLNFKRILDCFGIMFGLSINFDKLVMIPINCEDNWVETVTKRLGCSNTSMPIKYLGISLGASPKRVSTWNPIIEKIRKKLVGWKANLIS